MPFKRKTFYNSVGEKFSPSKHAPFVKDALRRYFMKKLLTLLIGLTLCSTIAVSTACNYEQSTPPPTIETPVPDEEEGENGGGMDEETPDNAPQTPTVTDYLYCTGNGVNIRQTASTSGKIVGSAYKGDKLSIVQKGEKWHSILFKGAVAYVSAAYCATTPPSTSPPPQISYDEFVLCTGDSVNLRTSASTSASIVGTAKKGKYFALVGQQGNFYKVRYRYSYAYISKNYAQKASMKKSADSRIEKVLSVAYTTIGTPYVYGAKRLHGGTGILIAGFDKNKMDCSSLAQYVMHQGAGINIGMNTATQQSQGKLVNDDLKRGDLMFFTSPQYASNSLPTKIRHVGIYLGDNYMLHTANTRDNAEIIRLTDTGYWWRYLVFARRHF